MFQVKIVYTVLTGENHQTTSVVMFVQGKTEEESYNKARAKVRYTLHQRLKAGEIDHWQIDHTSIKLHMEKQQHANGY